MPQNRIRLANALSWQFGLKALAIHKGRRVTHIVVPMA